MNRVTRSLLQVGIVLFLVTLPSVAAGGTSRFASTGGWEGRADWLTFDEDRIVFGSGTRVFLASNRTPLRVESELRIDEPAQQAVLIGNRLYLSDGRALT